MDRGPLPLGGRKQRLLLAELLLARGGVVSREKLIDGLWGERPPPSAAESLDTYVYRLRKTLGHDRLVREAGGYRLRVEPDELDADRFEQLVATASCAADAGDHAAAAAKLTEALELWRGAVAAELLDGAAGVTEARRLEEMRLSAMELRVEARLALGAGKELVPQLEQFVAEHPLRERLIGGPMLALYRAGRQTDALGAFQTARARLTRELGLEPGPGLHELQRRILQHDPTLGSPRFATPVGSRHRSRPRRLRACCRGRPGRGAAARFRYRRAAGSAPSGRQRGGRHQPLGGQTRIRDRAHGHARRDQRRLRFGLGGRTRCRRGLKAGSGLGGGGRPNPRRRRSREHRQRGRGHLGRQQRRRHCDQDRPDHRVDHPDDPATRSEPERDRVRRRSRMGGRCDRARAVRDRPGHRRPASHRAPRIAAERAPGRRRRDLGYRLRQRQRRETRPRVGPGAWPGARGRWAGSAGLATGRRLGREPTRRDRVTDQPDEPHRVLDDPGRERPDRARGPSRIGMGGRSILQDGRADRYQA